MAFSITGDKAFPVDQGDYYVVTTTDLTITDGDEYSRLHCSTLPTVGTLYKNGVVMTTSTQFSVQDITDGLIVYSNDGVSDTNDAPEFIATPYDEDGVAGTPTAAAAVTVTVTAGNAWVLFVTPNSEAPQLVGYNVERYVMDLAAIEWAKISRGTWESAVVGASDVIDVTDFITADDLTFVNGLISTVNDPADYNSVISMKIAILGMLQPASWDDAETAITNSGSTVYTNNGVMAALDQSVQNQLHELRARTEVTHSRADFLWAVDLASADLA